MKRLSASSVHAYRVDGCLYPVPIFDEAEAAACRQQMAAAEAGYPVADRAKVRAETFRYKPHLILTWLDRLVHDPRLLDAVEDLIGPDILVWASALFIKDPHDPSYVAWHQDSVTYGLDGTDLVSAWIALTDTGPANAAMRYIPGSHRNGPLPHRDTWAPHNALSRGEVIDIAVDERQAVNVTLQTGEVGFHNIDLIHGSPPNGSDRPRIGYAVRYMPPHMRAREGPASAMLARGADRFGHFELEPRPAADMDAAAGRAHRHAMDLRMRAVFGSTGKTGDGLADN